MYSLQLSRTSIEAETATPQQSHYLQQNREKDRKPPNIKTDYVVMAKTSSGGVPFVLESTGAWGPSVVRFVQLLGSHLEYVGSAEAALNRHQQKHPLYVYGLPSGAGFWGFMRRALAVLIARTNSTIFFSASAHTHYAQISNSE